MQRIPMNYKPKKTPHIIYYDIENGHDKGVDLIKQLKVHEFNVSFKDDLSKVVDFIVDNIGSSRPLVHHIPFSEAEKDRADQQLLQAFKRDLNHYKAVPNITYVLYTHDKKFQEKFRNLAIQGSAFFKVVSPVATQIAA